MLEKGMELGLVPMSQITSQSDRDTQEDDH
jgi:hypothetical protein